MEQTKEDGKNIGVAESQHETAPAESTGKTESPEAGKIEAPFHGFDNEGEYFIVKVHKSFGYIFILGWLLKSSDWIKMYVTKQVMDEKEKDIIKPKGFRGFNPFKK